MHEINVFKDYDHMQRMGSYFSFRVFLRANLYVDGEVVATSIDSTYDVWDVLHIGVVVTADALLRCGVPPERLYSFLWGWIPR